MIRRVPRMFVEAKALGENLDDPRWANQILAYAVAAGVEWVVLTNGDEYRIYNSHAAVPVEEKLFRTICGTDNRADVAEALGVLSKDRTEQGLISTLWKAHSVDRQMRSALEALFAPDPDPSLVRLLAKRLPALPPSEIRAGLGRIVIRLDVPDIPPRTSEQTSESREAVRRPANARLATPASPSQEPDPASASRRDASIHDLIASDLIRPPLELEKTYKGNRLTGRLEPDGRVTCLGETFDSLSTSAGAARASIIGAPPGRRYPQTNGWVFWRFRDNDGRSKPLDFLRQRFQEQKR
jgi:hypothetical protein